MSTQTIENPPVRTLPELPETLRKLCEDYWDIQADYCAILNADGWTDEEIAAALGIPVEDVVKFLYPVDKTLWEGFISGFFEEQGSEQKFRAEVNQIICRSKSFRYRMSAGCAMIEGREHLRPELERMSQRYTKEADRWSEQAFPKDQPPAKRIYFTALRLTAGDAARLALGIDGPEKYKNSIAEREICLGLEHLKYWRLLEAIKNHRQPVCTGGCVEEFKWVQIGTPVKGAGKQKPPRNYRFSLYLIGHECPENLNNEEYEKLCARISAGEDLTEPAKAKPAPVEVAV